MSIKDALLAAIDSEESGGIKGRTLLQKRMYFLAVLADEDFLFYPYYYGPYSSDVADQLGALREAALVSEQSEPYPDVLGPFGEFRRYDYRLTNSGRQVVKQRGEGVRSYRKALRRINSHPAAQNASLLSTAAKVHFIVTEHGQATADEIRQRAEELGWRVPSDETGQIVDYLEHLGLVKAQRQRSP